METGLRIRLMSHGGKLYCFTVNGVVSMTPGQSGWVPEPLLPYEEDECTPVPVSNEEILFFNVANIGRVVRFNTVSATAVQEADLPAGITGYFASLVNGEILFFNYGEAGISVSRVPLATFRTIYAKQP